MALADFERLLTDTIGLDVASIGPSTIERAVADRKQACALASDEMYLQRVRASDAELHALINAVVVPETWFYRDRDVFAALGELAHREWVAAPAARTLRLLSLPCASGEEPYTMAMTLLDAGLPAHRFEVDAVDISEPLLAQARRGVYGRGSFRTTDLEFRDRYFKPVAGGHQIARLVQQQVRFQQGNMASPTLLADVEPYDVVFCRNVLIYFDRPTRERVVNTVSRLLTPTGMLFIGSSETGVLFSQDFRSAKIPMAFAFHKGAPHETRHGHGHGGGASKASRRGSRAGTAAVTQQPEPDGAALQGPAPVRPAPVRPTPTRPSRADRDQPNAATLEHARRLADRGEFAEAAAYCEAHLTQHGPSAEAFYLLGLVRDASGSPADAGTYYRKALYLDPVHGDALLHLALLLEQQGRPADSKALMDRARRVSTKAERTTADRS